MNTDNLVFEFNEIFNILSDEQRILICKLYLEESEIVWQNIFTNNNLRFGQMFIEGFPTKLEYDYPNIYYCTNNEEIISEVRRFMLKIFNRVKLIGGIE